jgi:hypothetical protein
MRNKVGRLAHVALCVSIGLFIGPGTATSQTQSQSQVIELREWFGVNHPLQLIEFKLPKRANVGNHLEDESGKAIPFQLLEQGNKLAFCSDLPAGVVKKWHWLGVETKTSVSTVQIVNPVEIKKTATELELGNGLVAVRIPTAETIKLSAGNRSQSSLKALVDIFNYGPSYPRVLALAPIQGICLHDKTWTATESNALVAMASSLTDVHVDLIEKGPLKTVITIKYDFAKPEYIYGKTRISDAGPGYLAVTMTLLANQPSIFIEEETDVDEVWSLNAYDGVSPNQGRYSGFVASEPRFGHLPDGSVFPADKKHGETEALVDLQYDHPQLPSYLTSNTSWEIMAPSNPWINNSGWYWELYDTATKDAGNLIGVFVGPTSRALEPSMSGPGIFTLPQDIRSPGKPVAGIASQSYRRSPDAHIGRRSRFAWGIFSGVKDKDLTAAPHSVPAINLQMNLFGSPTTLTKLAAMKMDYPDLPQGYGGLFMDRLALSDLIQRIRRGKKDRNGGPYGWLYNAEPSSRALFDAWADASGSKMHEAANDIICLARDLEYELAYGRGIHSFRFGYWHGGLEMMRRGLWIDQVLASNQLSADERNRVKAAASLFGHILWDNDFVPMDNSSGINMGTANMPQQQQGYRYFYALFLATHPDFKQRAELVNEAVQLQVKQQINESGAHMGCPHYISASFAPTLNTLMQLQQLGQRSPLETDPRLKKFAQFYLNLLTPPEIRFPGNPRSLIALGDSSTEASPLYGQLGTALSKIDKDLSEQLMAAWQAGGKPHSGFFGTTVMSIDDCLPGKKLTLRSATFPGYYSVLRSGFNSINETAAWIVNGDFYRDHRANDSGSVVLYALGVPLSVHWGSIYSPSASNAFYQSSIIPESALGWEWNRPSPPTDVRVRSGWSQAKQLNFSIGDAVDSVSSQFTGQNVTWNRLLQLHHSNSTAPVLMIKDSFEGAACNQPKIFSLNLMAKGVVQTPVGEIVPEIRTHTYAAKATNANQLPSASRVITLEPGVSRFAFTGQFGVDFDLYIISQQRQECSLGNWAVSWTQQSLTKWEERQHILRIRGTGPFQVVLVPYRSGRRPADLTVRNSSRGLILTSGGAAYAL